MSKKCFGLFDAAANALVLVEWFRCGDGGIGGVGNGDPSSCSRTTTLLPVQIRVGKQSSYRLL